MTSAQPHASRWAVLALVSLALVIGASGGGQRSASGQSPAFVIAILGDSYASGEGNPPYVDHAGCHRSEQSGHWQAAQSIRDSSTMPVKVGFFACTGARVQAGLLEAHSGNASQLDALQQWMKEAGVTAIDVLTLSIGGNDAHFREIVDRCLMQPEGNCAADDQLTASVSEGLSSLGPSLKMFHENLSERNVVVKRVLLTSYPNAVRNSAGQCHPGLYTEVLPRWVSEENLGYADRFVTALNGALSASQRAINQTRQGSGPVWAIVDSHLEAFSRHSLCDPQPWYRSFWNSIMGQSNWDGTMHPTVGGQDAIRDALLGQMSGILVAAGGESTP